MEKMRKTFVFGPSRNDCGYEDVDHEFSVPIGFASTTPHDELVKSVDPQLEAYNATLATVNLGWCVLQLFPGGDMVIRFPDDAPENIAGKGLYLDASETQSMFAACKFLNNALRDIQPTGIN